jgi:hypothetical protein
VPGQETTSSTCAGDKKTRVHLAVAAPHVL